MDLQDTLEPNDENSCRDGFYMHLFLGAHLGNPHDAHTGCAPVDDIRNGLVYRFKFIIGASVLPAVEFGNGSVH